MAEKTITINVEILDEIEELLLLFLEYVEQNERIKNVNSDRRNKSLKSSGRPNAIENIFGVEQ